MNTTLKNASGAISMNTEQMQAILDGAPSGAVFWITRGEYHNSPLTFPNMSGQQAYKLRDIRAELSSRQSQTIDKSACLSNVAENDRQSDIAAFADALENQDFVELPDFGVISDEMKSVIERFTNLAESFREIGKQFQSPRSIERGIWIAAAMYIERELKEVAGDE